MYISLYTAEQLRRAKETTLWLGLFMLSGGLAALINEIIVQDGTRWYWAGAAFVIALVGALLVAAGTGKVQLSEAYFSITPARISYRLHLLGQERMIYWQQIAGMQMSDRHVLFDLNDGRQVLLRLEAIQSDTTANFVAIGLQTAALEHNVTVNGIKFNTHNAGGIY